MITYFIKSGLCLALLLAFYHLVLEREKMHQFNRFYLLGSVLFSFVAPLYKIYIEVAPLASEIVTPIIIDNNITMEVVPLQTEETDYTQYLLTVYAIIALILLVRFTKNLTTISLKIKQHQKIKKEKASLVLVEDAISPHTFWNYIFINKEEYNLNKIETELYTHELTHVLQKHTFDILLIELLQIIFWINPTFIFLKKAIKLNHEFLADNKVITTHKNTTEYQYLLLNRTTWNNEYYLASNLNYLLTKKRLLMMTKRSSRSKILLKKLAVIPLLAGFTLLFAERIEAYENVNNNEFLDTVIEKKEISDGQISNTSEVLTDINKKLKDANSLKMSIANNKTSGNFIALVERDDNNVYLKCYNCKRWAGLEIPLNKEYTITDWGFSTNKHVEIGKYAFTIKATEKEIVLKGIKNVSWNTLTIPLKKNKKQYLNQNGLFNYKRETLKDINEKLKNVNSLKMSISEKKDTFNVVLHNGEKIKIWETKDSIPAPNKTLKRVLNHHKGTFTYTSKEGTTITKKINELTEEEKKMLPPPPPHVRLKEKPLSIKLFEELKNAKKYAIWIDGKSFSNEILQKYKNTDFFSYMSSFVHKNARSNRFPQEYQYQLFTKKHIQQKRKQLLRPHKTSFPEVKKEDTSNIPPPPAPMSAEELVLKYPNSTFLVNNKIVTYKQVLDFVKKNKDVIVSTSEKNGKKIIAFNLNQKKHSKEEVINLTYNKVISGPEITNFVFKYYLDNKPITKHQLNKIKPNKISNIEVKANQNSNVKIIYITSKK